MAIYVDNVRILWRGRRWCHMVAEDLDELHRFASKLGMKKEWFQSNASYPHYDITIETKLQAIKLGAVEGDRFSIIRCGKKLKIQLEASVRVNSQAQLDLGF